MSNNSHLPEVHHNPTSVGHDSHVEHEALAPVPAIEEELPALDDGALASVAPETADINTPVGVIVLTKHKIAKGKHSGSSQYLPEAIKSTEAIDAFAELVGPDNFYRELNRALKPFFASAYEESKSADGTPEESKYVASLIAEFQPHQRRAGGPTVRELLEKQAELVASAGELLSKIVDGSATDGEKHQASVIMLEFNKLAQAIEKKSRTGKKKSAVPAVEPKH